MARMTKGDFKALKEKNVVFKTVTYGEDVKLREVTFGEDFKLVSK